MLTKRLPGALDTPAGIEKLNHEVNEQLKGECSGVKWLSNDAICGPGDYIDIFEAPDTGTAMKVALLVRSFGRASAEFWPATPWDKFLDTVKRRASRPHADVS
jgi:uncharacterized protein with GYD domain